MQPKKRLPRKKGTTLPETILNRGLALDLRIKHFRYREIAEQLHVSEVTAWQYVQDALKELSAREDGGAKEYRRLEEERLDALAQKFQAKADAGDAQAAALLLKISERRARLRGLDAPTKLTGADGGPVAVSFVDMAREVDAE